MSDLNEKWKSRTANKFLSIKIKQIPNFAIGAGALTEDGFFK